MFAASSIILAFLPLIISIFLLGMSIYFVVKAIQFMNNKTKLDQERNQLLKELVNKGNNNNLN